MSRLGQYQGCLVGCAIGDAIGAPVEMLGPDDVAVYIERHVLPGDFIGVFRKERGYRWEGFPFGQYTDDTQMTIALAESLVSCEGLKMEDWGRRIGEMFERDLVVGGGRSTRAAAERLAEGTPWSEAGTPLPAAGNGAAMRAAPIGLCFGNNAGVIQPAADQGYATHQSSEACAGSVAIATATALAIENCDPISMLIVVAGNLSTVDAGFGTLVYELSGRMERGEGEEEVLRWVLDLQTDKRWPGISPWAVSSVLWSLFSFASHPDNFMDTIVTALRPGGDVDSTAAMAGAISGARLGIDALPENLALQVNDRGERGAQFLKDLAGQLHKT